jgi:two-component system cell cycle sensor histidine kinase/response regulator CckA
LLVDTGRLFERTLQKNVLLKVEPWYEPALIRGDKPALENALLNLALNAQDAMPDGGTLSLSARVVQVDDACSARLNRAIAPGRAIVICLRDTGTGMSEGVRERLFEPFFTTKGPGRGTGLGLAAVYGTVRNHHGAIDVSSEDGHGSTFELYFPEVSRSATTAPRELRATTALDSAPALGPRAEALPFRARVLLADDEPLVRKTMVMMLTAAGCEVQAVDNGEALLLALTHGATPDMIVSDLMMPGLSGLNLVRTLQATRPGCPLLLITGYTGDDVSSALEQSHNHRLLRKPFSQTELMNALAELLPPQAQPAQSA